MGHLGYLGMIFEKRVGSEQDIASGSQRFKDVGFYTFQGFHDGGSTTWNWYKHCVTVYTVHIYIFLLGQWLNFKLFGITYLVGKIKFKLFFFRVHWLSEYSCIVHLHIWILLCVYNKSIYIYTHSWPTNSHWLKAMMRACLDGVARTSTSRDSQR